MILIVYKPSEQKALQKKQQKVIALLQSKQKQYQLFATSGHFEHDVQAIKKQLNTISEVVVLGGDGTLHLVANCLAGQPIPLAIIPSGTGNDFARQWQFSEQQWLESVISEDKIKIDLGIVNARYFINVAGAGFDGEVVKLTADQKSKVAPMSYLLTALKLLRHHSYHPWDYVMDKQKVSQPLMMASFANGQYFGSGMRLAPQAQLQDGQLVSVLVKQAAWWRQARALMRSFWGGHLTEKSLQIAPCTQAKINTAGIALQADGEFIGYSPAQFSVAPQALYLKLPYGVKRA